MTSRFYKIDIDASCQWNKCGFSISWLWLENTIFYFLTIHFFYLCIVVLNWVIFILYSSFIFPLECCFFTHFLKRMLCLFTHDLTILRNWHRVHSCQWNICYFEIIDFLKTKQFCYYWNLFSRKYLLSYLCWLSTSGFKCQRPNIFSLARPMREIVHQYVIYRNEDSRPLLITYMSRDTYNLFRWILDSSLLIGTVKILSNQGSNLTFFSTRKK
jgi:hypothetical protein